MTPQTVRIRGTHGTFSYHGPSRDGTAFWLYGPTGSQQRQWRAVAPNRVRFLTARPKPKPKPPTR